jgi:hypothetical protein
MVHGFANGGAALDDGVAAMTSIVERVAREICEDDRNVWEDADADMREAYLSNARRAIHAMSTPSKAMCEACLESMTDATIADPKAAAWDGLRAYRAMIDAALNEEGQA